MLTVLFVLTLASDMAGLYENDAILVLQFFEIGLCFPENLFQSQVLKKFKISTDYHVKTC